jgi:hypothetical protein
MQYQTVGGSLAIPRQGSPLTKTTPIPAIEYKRSPQKAIHDTQSNLQTHNQQISFTSQAPDLFQV